VVAQGNFDKTIVKGQKVVVRLNDNGTSVFVGSVFRNTGKALYVTYADGLCICFPSQYPNHVQSTLSMTAKFAAKHLKNISLDELVAFVAAHPSTVMASDFKTDIDAAEYAEVVAQEGRYNDITSIN
jgi:hypothetical protein